MRKRLLVWAKRLAITLAICLGLLIVLTGGLLVFLGTETGLNTAASLASRFTDGRFRLEKASGSLYGKANLQGLRYVDTGLDVSLKELQLDWSAAELWHRHLAVAEIRLVGLRLFVASTEEEQTPPGDEPISIPEIDLPIRISLGRVQVDDFSFFSQPDSKEPDFQLKEGLVQGLAFADQHLSVERISVENREILAQARIEAQTIASYPLQIALTYHYAREDLPLIDGQARLSGSLPDLRLETELQSPAPLRVQAQALDALENPRWNLRVEGGAELAKIMADLPDMRVSDLLIIAQGTAEEYRLNLQLHAIMEELGKEPLQLSSELEGNLRGLSLQTLRLSHNQASLAADGQLTWEPELSWQMQVKAARLDPSFLLAEWPADINLELKTKGQIQGEGLEGIEAELQLDQLSGKLRGFPLEGEGNISLQAGHLHIPNFALRCASSSLRLQGDYAEKADLRLNLDVPDLQTLVPEIKGKLAAKGRLKGSPGQLDVDLQVQADRLEMAEAGIKQLRLDAKGELSSKRFPQLHLNAKQLQFGETTVESVGVQLEGSVADNKLNLEVKSQDAGLHLGLQGKADLENMAWSGQIRDTRIELPQIGLLQQKQASGLQLGASEVKLAPFCLVMDNNSLCVNASLTDDQWQARTKVDRLDLALLEKFPDLKLPAIIRQYGGFVVLDLNATGQAAEVRQASVDLGLKDLFLVLAPEDGAKEHRLQWDQNQVQIQYANNSLNATLRSNLPKQASVAVDLRMNNVDPAKPDQILASPVQGKLQLNVEDFSLVNLLSEKMVNIDGTLKGNISLDNTLATPMINGNIELDGGKADLAPLGISLSPLSLQMQSNSKGLDVRGLIRSGEGQITVDTNLPLQDFNLDTATITVKGESFQALNLPEMALVISPDLQILVNKERIDVQGTVTVPSANISSTIDISNAVTASDDVVVVDDEEAMAAGPSLPLYLRVKVVFGDDVRIDTYGLRGRIVGNLEVRGEPERPMLGTGTLQVKDGTFTFMSRRLGLDLSRLLFTGGPLNNPGVDLRVETDDGKVKAGLTVQGTLRRQEINLYSTPTMDQFTILRHLLENSAIGGETREDVGMIGDVADKVGMGGAVPYLQALKKFSMIDEIRLDTGDDFGSASLVFGSWVTPDFYISYGKSLLDETSTFNTRYTIGYGFFLTTNASSTASGGDVKYELER